MELKKHFITTCRPYKEGTVEAFQQNLKSDNVKKATLTKKTLRLQHVRNVLQCVKSLTNGGKP